MTALSLLLAAATAVAQPRGEREPDPFRAHAVEGAFALLDTGSGEMTVLNRRLAARRFAPFSTFKIPNTLIGLETGVIPDRRFSLRWDGTRHRRADWNRDHDLASAMKFSVLWFYQEVARRIGRPRMTRWVRALGYGDREVAGAIDRFWLDGSLAISALEQVDFMRRLQSGRLPVSAAHRALLFQIIELARGGDWVLHGKTGLGWQDGRAIGWLVGSVEHRGRIWIYALLLRGRSADRLMPLRREIGEQLLRRHGALPAD